MAPAAIGADAHATSHRLTRGCSRCAVWATPVLIHAVRGPYRLPVVCRLSADRVVLWAWLVPLCLGTNATRQTKGTHAPRPVLLHPNGGQVDFVRSPARIPHEAYA